MDYYTKEQVIRFIEESNAIENEYGTQAIEDSLIAWWKIAELNTLKIEDICNCHHLIMQNLYPSIAGKFRDIDVYIGDAKGYPPHTIKSTIETWLVLTNIANTVEEIKESHIWFEIIHPFVDGNGRIGRMILLWQSQKAGLPFAIIKADTKFDNYYPWFTQARYLEKYKYKGD